MSEIFILFTLIYSVLSFSFVYKTDLFINVGLTIENLFDRYLGREQDNFVLYHIKRTCVSTLVHLSLHCGFFIGTSIFKADAYFVSLLGQLPWQLILFGSLVIPIHALCVTLFHYQQGWDSHPIVAKLKMFESERYNSWVVVQNEINTEYKQELIIQIVGIQIGPPCFVRQSRSKNEYFSVSSRRMDKTILYCGNRMKLVLLRNWIIRVGPYDLDFAHQNDARLLVKSADTQEAGNNGHSGVLQFINVEVVYLNESRTFSFRLHALDFKDLKEGLRCPIEVSPNVTFYQTKSDQFLQIFKEFAENNPSYTFQSEEDSETCIGCMTAEANVKLVKNCTDDRTVNETDDGIAIPLCVPCQCRPLWCMDCMGKWFASRQNPSATETWLSSKCPCPVCRCTFCMLDVSPVNKVPPRPI